MTIEEARTAVLSEALPLPSEDVVLAEALDRVTTRESIASHDLPPFDRSTKDGFAVRSEDTRGATRDSGMELSIVGTIPAGTVPDRKLERGQAAKIMTGAPLPAGADAVIMRERVQERDGRVTVFSEVAAVAHVRRAGDDVGAGQVALPAGTILGPGEIGLLAGLGIAEVAVHRRPRVAIVSTGSELVAADETPGPGQIHGSNSYLLSALCAQLGIDADFLGIVRDDREATRLGLERGLAHDMLVTTGGVSVGDFDFVKEALEELGVQRRVWGVAMKPGRPLVFGARAKTLVFCLPGNPAAAAVCFELLVRPALLRLMGHAKVSRPVYTGLGTAAMRAHKDMVRLVTVHASHSGQGWSVTPLAGKRTRGMGSDPAGNGLAFVPAGARGVGAGEPVEFVLTRQPLE